MKFVQPITSIYTPGRRLRPWVESYILLNHKGNESISSIPWTIMPDCSGYLIFHLLNNHSRVSIVGPRSVFKNINRKGRIFTLIVKFNPGRMVSLLPFPVSEIKDSSVLAQSALGASIEFLNNQVNELIRKGDIRQCLFFVEQFLLEKLVKSIPVRYVTEYAATHIRNKEGSIKVSEIADKAGVSSRYLRKVFSEDVGLSPKRYAMVTRITNIVKSIDEGEKRDWVDIALSSNYFDQSHLVEDFNLLLGESPEVFMNRSNREEIL